MIVLYFLSEILALEPGCNDMGKNGQSACLEYSEGSFFPGLRCCLHFRRGVKNFFETPIVVIPSNEPMVNSCRPHRSPFNYKPSSKCIPTLKCTPQNFNDLKGFYNFLDLYNRIPFENFPDRNKSSNWNCFNSKDNFEYNPSSNTRSNPRLKSTHARVLRNRLGNNFCRTVLYDYFIIGFRFLSQDICGDYLQRPIYPFQRTPNIEKLRDFNPLDDHPATKEANKLEAPIKTINHAQQRIYTSDIEKYLNNRDKTFVTVFSDFHESWRDLNVNSSSVLEYHCGCFN